MSWQWAGEQRAQTRQSLAQEGSASRAHPPCGPQVFQPSAVYLLRTRIGGEEMERSHPLPVIQIQASKRILRMVP